VVIGDDDDALEKERDRTLISLIAVFLRKKIYKKRLKDREPLNKHAW